MKITKYEHACIDIQTGSGRLIVDPGSFAKSLVDLHHISVVVVTHAHQDHFDEQKVRDIVKTNPGLRIFSTTEVAEKHHHLNITIPELGEIYEIGDIKLEFFGELHAEVLPGIAQSENFGVLINSKLYYPGDSFTPCPKPHNVLAIPSDGPWMKLSEAVEFIHEDEAKTIFPIHDGFLNDDGQNLANGLLRRVAEVSGKTYLALSPKDSFNIKS